VRGNERLRPGMKVAFAPPAEGSGTPARQP
jgi:hypothetical protein